jgi:hypothetical protein
MQLQPVLHIDSEAGTAKGRWRTLMMVGFLGKEGRWGEATYENEYLREDGRWRIARLHGIVNFYCEYDQGWHRGGVALLRSIEGLAPDRPPSLDYEAYPEPVIAPFPLPRGLILARHTGEDFCESLFSRSGGQEPATRFGFADQRQQRVHVGPVVEAGERLPQRQEQRLALASARLLERRQSTDPRIFAPSQQPRGLGQIG